MLSITMEFNEITLNNLSEIVNLTVSKSQEHFVADNCYSIEQVGLNPDSWCRGIYCNGVPVGFFSVQNRPNNVAYIWRYMIDKNHQGKGYGKSSLIKLNDILYNNGAQLIELTVIRKTGGPEEFYRKCGFKPTEECIHGEWRMIHSGL